MSADFRGKGASPTNHCWYQSSRVIALSCGIKLSAVRHLVLSQYTHLMDRQTDGQTEFRQQYRALHYMQSHGKKAKESLSEPPFRARNSVFALYIKTLLLIQYYFRVILTKLSNNTAYTVLHESSMIHMVHVIERLASFICYFQRTVRKSERLLCRV